MTAGDESMNESHTSRLDAALAGRYRIERKLGEGGMASVYLAEDVKHERKVALKILRPELAAVIGAERFLAEIKTTANLQHPHILALFDSGEADGFLYYVMPYVEGETLRDRLDREGQLGVEEAVRIAREVADALDYAHRSDVIHRDIKPANILLHDGRPVVADFGIALAISAAGGGRMTETGLSLGTPHYMSPEQASADRDLSARSDVYSLGCVLYEMLAGQPPHTGPSAQSILVRILTEDPRDVMELRRTVPPNVAATVMKSIEKLPADRFDSAKDFVQALEDVTFSHTAVSRGLKPTPAPLTVPAVAVPTKLVRGMAAAIVVLAGLAAWGWLGPTPPGRLLRTDLLLPDDVDLNIVDRVVVSPDGSAFAIAAEGPDGRLLYVRRANESEFRALPGTDGALTPTFSPDSRWIAFRARGGLLKKVSLAGGQPLTLVGEGAVGAFAPHWGDDGTIAFTGSNALYSVPETGGQPTLLLEGAPHRGAHVLPGGRGVLLNATGSSIGVVTPGSDSLRIVISEGVDPWYLESGHLLFRHPNGGIQAVTLDLNAIETTSDPVPVLDDIGGSFAGPYFSVSDEGTAVYMTGRMPGFSAGQGDRFMVVDAATGDAEMVPLESRPIGNMRYSPDGRRVAFSAEVPGQIFVYDIEIGTAPRQLTFQGFNADPVWSPDGTRVAFESSREGTAGGDIYVKTVDDDSPEQSVLTRPGDQIPLDWPADTVLLFEDVEGSSGDYWLVNPTAGGEPRSYLRSEADLDQASISPDGRYIAYDSDEQDGGAIYVRSFPVPGQQTRVSPGPARTPRWSPDGKAIYYWNLVGQDTLFVSRVDPGPPFVILSTEAVTNGSVFGRNELAVHPDGTRLLVLNDVVGSTLEGDAIGPLARFVVVTNWFEEMKARMGEGR